MMYWLYHELAIINVQDARQAAHVILWSEKYLHDSSTENTTSREFSALTELLFLCSHRQLKKPASSRECQNGVTAHMLLVDYRTRNCLNVMAAHSALTHKKSTTYITQESHTLRLDNSAARMSALYLTHLTAPILNLSHLIVRFVLQ